MTGTRDLPGRIGPYRIESVLGEGGMGVVYAAEQIEPVRRRVALKLIRGGTAGDDIAARFDAERQALAVMAHPGIAKVLDAGTTEGGSPYFVMEFVDGAPITDFCDERSLGVDERLGLFLQVCDAIQHAHQKGVIHRDLKPSNILVTEQAGSPLPKIIDFGIAKAVGTKLTEKTLATSMGQVLGTPAYMSPEQAEGTGLDVDTRADVYALGVILYELLVGLVPIDPDEMGFLAFVTALITEDVPTPRPSARLGGDPEKVTTTAARRGTTPEVLRRRLSGDLDWIAMKALETDRERRYGSARDLAADVDRVLRDEPVLARPPSTSYRMQKFVRRNRAAVLGAAAAVLLLIGGTIASAIGLARANRAEAAAVREGDRALREATTANEATEFLVGLFNAANPGVSGQPNVTAREMLEGGVAGIEAELAGQPEIQARLYETMAWVFSSLSDYDRARELMRRSLDLREETFGPESPEYASGLSTTVNLYEATSLVPHAQLYADGELLEMAERALRIREAHATTDSASWLSSFRQVAFMYARMEQVEEAERLLLDRRGELAAALGEAHPFVTSFDFDLAAMYANDGQREKSIERWEHLLALAEAASPPDSARISEMLNNLGVLTSGLDQPDRSIEFYERAREIDLALLGDEPKASLGRLYENLATAYGEVGRFEDAAGLYRELAVAFGEVYGPESPESADFVLFEGTTYLEAGDYERAAEVMERALELFRSAAERGAGGRHAFLSFPLSYYSRVLVEGGFDDPIGRILSVAGDLPRFRLEALHAVGWALEQEGDLVANERARRQALEIAEAMEEGTPDERVNRLREAFIQYEVALLRLRAADELLALGPRWQSAIARVQPGDNFATLQALRDMASVLYRGERDRDAPPVPSIRGEAVSYLERALAMRTRMEGDGLQLVTHLVPLRAVLWYVGREDESRAVQERIRSLLAPRVAELQALAADGEIIEAARWNTNCWMAALAELPEVALPACDAAVESANSGEEPRFRDSRAIARALLGDLDGAIEDLRAYLASVWPEHPSYPQRMGWVEQMEAGGMPFTTEVLGALEM